jgi:hypothetical protein
VQHRNIVAIKSMCSHKIIITPFLHCPISACAVCGMAIKTHWSGLGRKPRERESGVCLCPENYLENARGTFRSHFSKSARPMQTLLGQPLVDILIIFGWDEGRKVEVFLSA